MNIKIICVDFGYVLTLYIINLGIERPLLNESLELRLITALSALISTTFVSVLFLHYRGYIKRG